MNTLSMNTAAMASLPPPLPLETMQNRFTALSRALDELDYGLVMIDEHCRLRYANRHALSEFDRGRPVRLHSGAVHTTDSTEQPSLTKAVAAAIDGRRTLIKLGGAEGLLEIAAVPIDIADTAQRPLALLVFGKRRGSAKISVELFARSHGLTLAEVAVLRALCEGMRPAEAAERHGVAISTVRTQVSNILAKTATHSIRELVSRVASLPPIATAVREGFGEPVMH